jgi:hypothetical protein
MYDVPDASMDAKIKFRLFLQQRCAARTHTRLSFVNSIARARARFATFAGYTTRWEL